MRILITTLFSLAFCLSSLAQPETLSFNIYQYNGRLGIGTDDALHLFHIKDNAGRFSPNPRQFILLENLNNGSHSHVAIGLKSGISTAETYGSLGLTSHNYSAIPGLRGYTYLYDKNSGITFRAVSPSGVIRFWTGGDRPSYERMRIDEEGKIGIGTEDPLARLHVANGDIYISQIQKGIVMRSEDGQCWRGTVDNSGSLNFVQIDCNDLDNTVNVDVRSYKSAIAAFPNPTNGKFSLGISEFDPSFKFSYKIYNLHGNMIESGEILSAVTNIDISKNPAGTYIIQFFNDKGEFAGSQKIVLQ